MDFIWLGLFVIIFSITIILFSIIFHKYIYIFVSSIFTTFIYYMYAMFVGKEVQNEYDIGDESGEEFYVQMQNGSVRID